ncbi:MAG: Lrp/AsnC family transcriptional regulator [Chitinophagaceae bacterium]|nr:MAG: Lrp/AsnC family transcriptional regulator [Chitinophagaceae bacterium]
MKNNTTTVDSAISTTTIPLDEKDLAILRLLQNNARITVKEVADQIHLSTTPVHERIKRLESTGVIKQYATLIDGTKVKKGLMVICYVSLNQHSKKTGGQFIKLINELPEVVECYSISGEFDFMLKIVTEDMNSYYNFHVNKLSQAENIGQVQSVFIMGVVKQTHVMV